MAVIIGLGSLTFGQAGTGAADGKIATLDELVKVMKYPLGPKNDAHKDHFIGQSYNIKIEGCLTANNVTFEPCCRNNWHIHHNGTQILIGAGGIGWYQEWGKEPQMMKEGDVIRVEPGLKHWHGAAKDSWFSHIAAIIPLKGQTVTTEWLEPVADEEYMKLK